MRITNKEQLTAHGNREGRKIVAELLDAGLDALDPYVRVKQLVHVETLEDVRRLAKEMKRDLK